jgi:hypothetical protein
MVLILNHGYPDLVGKRSAFCGYGNGPKSYVTGGDPVQTNQFQYYIDSVEGQSLTVDGLYYGLPIPSTVGPRATWKMKWIVASTNVEVANGVNLSASQMVVSGMGGTY